MITYRKLLEALKELDEEQLDMTVTVVTDDGEASGVADLFLVCELCDDLDNDEILDMLDENQPVLTLF